MWTLLVISYDGFNYYVIVVDHFTKYIQFYTLKQKSKVKESFIRFKALVENYFQHKIVAFYSNNGSEYLALKDYLATNDISHFTIPPYKLELNGYSER